MQPVSNAALYSLNTIAVKYETGTRNHRAGIDSAGIPRFVSKTVNRIKYLKVCWNCGRPYESFKYNSYGCCHKCSWSIHYKLLRGITPPANMKELTKAKYTNELKEQFGY